MDPFIIAAVISAVVIIILSIAFMRVSQPKAQGTLFRDNYFFIVNIRCAVTEHV